MKRYRLLFALFVLLVGGCSHTASTVMPSTATPAPPPQPLRVFWVNSFTKDDLWSMQVRTGILEVLAKAGYALPSDTLLWDEFHMQATQHTAEELDEIAQQAIEAIEAFKPDVVITCGNGASRLVIPKYPDTTLPFVYCGLSGNLREMGLRLPNVTGVLESYHPVQTVEIARTFVGKAQHYLILSDTSSAGQVIAHRSYRELVSYAVEQQGQRAWTGGKSPPDVLLVDRWPVWQRTVLQSSDSYDFILLGSYRNILQDNGLYMPSPDVMRWMFENSPVPVFALENQAVVHGAVGGLVTYGYAQGEMAARIVVQLANGVSPSEISERYPSHNLLAVNLSGVHHWGLRIPVTFPLAARVYRTTPSSPGGELLYFEDQTWALSPEGGQ